MTRYFILSLLIITGYAFLWVPAIAQDEAQGIKDARVQFQEIEKLQAKIENYYSELIGLNAKVQTASGDKRKELEDELMLKQRSMDRISMALVEKRGELYKSITALLDQNENIIELRKMRFELAFTMKNYFGVLKDAPVFKEEERDLDYYMIYAQSLENTGNFDKAITNYSKAIELMKGDQKSIALYQRGNCLMNVNRFKEALASYSELHRMAPPEQKQRFSRLVNAAEQYNGGIWEVELAFRKQEKEKDANPIVVLGLDQGQIKLELYEDCAPNTVANFIGLVESGFYDGLPFFRNIPHVMVLTGCPKGDGSGGPGYKIGNECLTPTSRMFFQGVVAMYSKESNQAESQFFITLGNTWYWNRTYTVFGRVIEGMDLVFKVKEGDTINSAKVIRKRDHDYKVKKL